jgi:uncharacterized protein (TIGR02117 family)
MLYSSAKILIIMLFSFSAFPVEGNASVSSVFTVYLVSRGYHTGIVVPAGPASEYILPLSGEVSGWAEFGWGESYYYQTPETVWSDAPRALLFSKGSVVRMESFPEGPGPAISRSGYAVRFNLTGEKFARLCQFIDQSFKKRDGLVVRESAERQGAVGYYTSVHSYHLFNTCNTWAARALEAAGTGVSSCGVIFASQLFFRAEEKGEVIRH